MHMLGCPVAYFAYLSSSLFPFTPVRTGTYPNLMLIPDCLLIVVHRLFPIDTISNTISCPVSDLLFFRLIRANLIQLHYF